jgi:putative aldouronate transport system permease protein
MDGRRAVAGAALPTREARCVRSTPSPGASGRAPQAAGLRARAAVVWRFRWIYLFLLPAALYFLVWKFYLMVPTVLMALKKMEIGDTVYTARWVLLTNFRRAFASPQFLAVLRNTFMISGLRIAAGFVPPILLAIFVFDLKRPLAKQAAQLVAYLPHFFSWVVVYGICTAIFAPPDGVVASMLERRGITARFFVDSGPFLTMLVGSGTWRDLGWSAILFLAALSSVDMELYDAAKVDGANAWGRLWHVTLPALIPITTLVFLLNIAYVVYAGFDQVIVFYNPAVYGVSDIIDTWVYRIGIQGADYGLGQAVALFQSIVGLVFI